MAHAHKSICIIILHRQELLHRTLLQLWHCQYNQPLLCSIWLLSTPRPIWTTCLVRPTHQLCLGTSSIWTSAWICTNSCPTTCPKDWISNDIRMAWILRLTSQCCGENLSDHEWKFDRDGYRCIHQLAGDRMTVKKLSDWLMIGKGTADLIIHYTEEDMELVKAGTFMMVWGDDGVFKTKDIV